MANQADNDIDRAVSDFEADINLAERNGEQTWLCPACCKVRCLFGQWCIFCRGEDDDYRDEQAMQSQLRHGG